MTDVKPSSGSAANGQTPDDPVGLTGLSGLAESTRVEAFSDGVLAIVVTLLVLDLKAPPGPHIGRALAEQWPAYVAYLGSFAYAGVIWVNHHYLFTRIRRVDGGVLWRNLLLLFAASVLPFPTSVVSESFRNGGSGDQAVALVLYSVISAGAVACWLSLFHYLSRHPELLHDSRHARFFGAERRRAWAGLAAYAVCAMVAFVLPVVALALALAVPLFYGVTSEGVGRLFRVHGGRRPRP